MAFRFPLVSLLRLWRSQQRQQELTLQRISNKVNRLRSDLSGVQKEISRISAEPPHGRSAGEIQFDSQLLHALNSRCIEIQESLRSALAERELAVAEFRRIWQRRETLETLQRKSQAAFMLDQARSAQRELDDWFLDRKLRN